jgi:hypothetical protein
MKKHAALTGAGALAALALIFALATPAVTQEIARLYATYAGQPIAVQSDAAGKMKVAVTGLSLTTAVWEDLVAPAGAINPIGADGQMTEITDAADLIGCLRADATGETAVIQFQLSHGMKLDTDIIPHLHYAKNDGADNTGTVTFQAKFKVCPLIGTCTAWTAFGNGTPGVIPADALGATGLDYWTLADSTYNFGISDVVIMQVKRSAGTTGSVAVCSADIHYQVDTLGSRQESVK